MRAHCSCRKARRCEWAVSATPATQSNLHVSYNSLTQYAHLLLDAMTRPYPPYERIGVADGEYRQLSTTLLQIENEFYGTIRPKRSIAQE
jgi:glutamate--cysteine ligase